MMEAKQQERIKVNKGVDKQARIFNLTIPYLSILAVLVLIGVVVLMSKFTFSLFVIIVIIIALLYIVLQYLDRINFLKNFKKSKIPKELINDIF